MVCNLAKAEIHIGAEMKLPELPTQLWMLWRLVEPGWLPAIDDPRGCTNYLVFFSKADAERGATHQLDLYEIASVPVRVK
jgi:hypothetical protein